MNDWLIAAGYIVAWLLGIWVGWYGLRPPQLRWPWHYSEADAYAKKYCSDELALARASEEAWQQARESDSRAMLENEMRAIQAEYADLGDQASVLRLKFRLVGERLAALRTRAATLSPPMASPTTDSPSDAAEQKSIPPESPASWRSGLATTTGGPAEHPSQSAQGTDAST